MIFQPLSLKDAMLVRPEPLEDARGFFARLFDRDEFMVHGLPYQFVQSSLSFNARKGTVRGMHYQVEPYAESKYVRVEQGAIYDVIVDLRPDSPTYQQWISVDLSAQNHHMLYIPKGFAHGFQTLSDNTCVHYIMDTPFFPNAAKAFRYNDPIFQISWPEAVSVISFKDSHYPDFSSIQEA